MIIFQQKFINREKLFNRFKIPHMTINIYYFSRLLNIIIQITLSIIIKNEPVIRPIIILFHQQSFSILIKPFAKLKHKTLIAKQKSLIQFTIRPIFISFSRLTIRRNIKLSKLPVLRSQIRRKIWI